MAQQVKAPGPTLEEEPALSCPLTITYLPGYSSDYHTHIQLQQLQEIFYGICLKRNSMGSEDTGP